MSTQITPLYKAERSWQPCSDPIIVGKDILDLLSSSMYIDPMTIYREYIQNAADAVDEARLKGLLSGDDTARVDIGIDSNSRTIRIRDNGIGIENNAFKQRLTSFGASLKRGTRARGFRGVGRLAGVGYCQELVFRSRTEGESNVSEMRWDCRKIKSIFRSPELNVSLQGLVSEAVETRLVPAKGWPERFFEVELRGVIRHKNDALLNPSVIHDYLAQVGPVPFSPEFDYGEEIVSALKDQVLLGDLAIYINENIDPIYRPHRNTIEVNGTPHDSFVSVRIEHIPSADGESGAIAWFLEHEYKGTIPSPLIRGIRLRSGNIQVGGHDLLLDLFIEPRFNSWSVGEVHTIDPRIVPNGRRDHYEQNVHFNNLLNQVSPIAREISVQCRRSSVKRNLLREFQRLQDNAAEKIRAIKQGSLSAANRSGLARDVENLLVKMQQMATRGILTEDQKTSMAGAIKSLQKKLALARRCNNSAKPLTKLSANKRKMYEQVFALIYECSTNYTNAHALVERILKRLG